MNKSEAIHSITGEIFLKASALLAFVCFCLAANVGHSLPLTEDFNRSLMEANEDPIPEKYQVKTIVLDAGHGGKDPGCLGKKITEKEVALDVVLRVGQMIKQNYPDVKVIYTRSTDEFIPLHKRAEIANSNQADLFISVHANAVKKRSVAGSETFVLGLHRAADNLEVAKRENAAILQEENHEQHYDGFDPNSDEGHIALSMYQNAYLDQSITLANLIETEFVSHAERKSRGVKQAGFIVLHRTYMPSVLVEVGFLTNAKEENFLISEDGKRKSATSIFNAFSKYKYDLESYGAELAKSGKSEEDGKLNAQAAPETRMEAASKQEVVQSKQESSQVVRTSPKQLAKPAKSDLIVANKPTKTETKEEIKPDAARNLEKPAKTQVANSSTTKQVTKLATQNVVTQGPIKYVVQVAAGSKKLTPAGKKWSSLEDVLIRFENGMYKYQIGEMDTYQAAVQRKQQLRKSGFSDCFVVAYRDGKSMKLGEAMAKR